jgi:diguanylate cyclase (GGDEF)-like protein
MRNAICTEAGCSEPRKIEVYWLGKYGPHKGSSPPSNLRIFSAARVVCGVPSFPKSTSIVKAIRPKSLARTIIKNPWSSVQDGLLLSSVMLVGGLLALQYNLFWFVSELSEPQRKISLAEAMFLTVLLALCIFAFVIRRLREARHGVARGVAAKIQVRGLKKIASQDCLTGLANRRVLISALTSAITTSSSGGRKHAFFLIDLNDFKHVNDLHGHAIGDRVLQVVAERFRSVARPSDLLVRLGGDEFAVLLYDVDRDTAHVIGLRFMGALESKVRVWGTLTRDRCIHWRRVDP